MATRMTSNSVGKKMIGLPTMPDEIKPFAHSAAGHEGISTSASGTMIVKPCTQAEIDFYKSASESPKHASFYAHMPTLFGFLQLSQNQDKLGPLLNPSGGVSGPTAKIQKPEPRPGIAPAPLPGTLKHTPTTTSLSVKRSSGTWKPSGGKKLETGLAVVIENAAAGVKKPCILDVKLGARLWDNDAPTAKKQKLDDIAKDSTSGSLGFRIAGMKVWLGDEQSSEHITTNGKELDKHFEVKDGYACYDKFYGRVFTKENVKHAFITYLGGADETGKLKRKYAKMITETFLIELNNIEYVLEHEESRMYSASILMVYEGDNEAVEALLQKEESNVQKGEHAANVEEDQADEDADEDADEEEGDAGKDGSDSAEPKVHEVRLIDFAHAKWTPGQGPDENALQGVRSVIKILKELV